MISSNAPQMRSASTSNAAASERLEKLRASLARDASPKNRFDEDKALVRLEGETGLGEAQASILNSIFYRAEALRPKADALFELAASRPELTKNHNEALDSLRFTELKSCADVAEQLLKGPAPSDAQCSIIADLAHHGATETQDRLFTTVLSDASLTGAHATATAEILRGLDTGEGAAAAVEDLLAHKSLTADQSDMIQYVTGNLYRASDFKATPALHAVLENPTFNTPQKDLMKLLLEKSVESNGFNETKAFVAVAARPELTQATAQRLEVMFRNAQPAPPSFLTGLFGGTNPADVNTKPFLALLEG